MTGSLASQEERIVHGCCPLDCPDTCGWSITVRDGKAVKLEGRKDHPVTAGALCAKMNQYLDYIQQPDRILYPLKRVGPKGSHRFERITWDEALTEIASRIQDARETYGGQAIWPYYGVGSFGLLQGLHGSGRRLWNVLGASNHLATICSIAGGIGTGFTIGDNRMGLDPETIALSKLVILWGTNTLSTNSHTWKFVDRARRNNGAPLVVIDPVKTRTAAQADHYFQIRPGTDAALALGLMNVIVSSGREDREFIDAHTLGFDQLKDRISEFDPARVADITGLDEKDIRWLGEKIASSRPTAIKMLMGVQRHSGGGMAVRTITCIPGITGDWRYPGGGVSYDTRGYFKANWQKFYRDDLRPAGTRTLSMTRLADNLLDLDSPPVKVLFLWMANPMASNPDQNRVRQALERSDLFTVAVEQFHTDTTAYADIVLPGTAQPEHADLHLAYGHVYLSWNEPAIAPPGECLPHTEIFRRLARYLGLKEPCLYASDDELAIDVLSSGHPWLADTSLERLKREGFVRPAIPTPAAVFSNGFPTPSGKLEFYSERMALQGHDPLAGYTLPAHLRQSDTETALHPFVLITPASHHFANSMFGRKGTKQQVREGQPTLMMNTDDAAQADLTDGSLVEVFNRRGSFIARLVVGCSVGRGVVAAPKGFWPGGLVGRSNVNAVIEERDSDMLGAVYSDCRVGVRTYEPKPDGL